MVKDIAKIQVPRRPRVAVQVMDDPYAAKVNEGAIPGNPDRLIEEDELAYKRFQPATGDMYLYDHEGHNFSLKNFYKGSQAFLVLSGPSLNDLDLTQLRERRGIVTMGVNNSWTIFKPNLWIGVDDPGNFVDIGWKDPSITKFTPAGHWNKWLVVKEKDGSFRKSQFRVKEMPAVYYFRRNNKFNVKRFLHEPTVNWGNGDKDVDELGCKGGRSVMLSAIRILHYLGFNRIYLLGANFHMSEDAEKNYAFQQHRHASSVSGNNSTYSKLNKRFTALLPEFHEAGLEIYNCYKDSGLTAFPYMSYEKAVDLASATCSKKVDTEGWYDRKEREKQRQKEKEAAKNIQDETTQ